MKQIRNLKNEVLKVTDLAIDHRFKTWVKWIDAIDAEKQNGYALVGEFVRDGTVEIEVGRPRLLLAQATSGSMKYRNAYYQVVRLNADGTLEALDIATDDKVAGWALRIRDRISVALAELEAAPLLDVGSNPLAEFSAEQLLAELSRRGVPCG